jgi:hypothetical protein
MTIADVDRRLPVGSPVDVEFAIDVKHNIEVCVRVRVVGNALRGVPGRCESITLQGPPAPLPPSRRQVEEAAAAVEELLQSFSGSQRARARARLTQLVNDLNEALFYEDDPKAIQRMAELHDLRDQLEAERGQLLEPPWTRFAQFVQYCRTLAAEVARATGRSRDELLDYIRAQERYAERAYQDKNQALYRECWQNLDRYANSLQDLRRAAAPDPLDPAPSDAERAAEDAKGAVEHLRNYLAAVWKEVRARGRKDLDERLARVAKQSQGLAQRVREDPYAALRETRRCGAEVAKVEVALKEGRSLKDDEETTTGLLEGML